MQSLDFSKAFWTLSKEELLVELQTQETGLSQDEVSKRQQELGLNKIEEDNKLAILKIFLRQFKSPLIFILIIAAIIAASLGDFKDAGFIALAVMINTWLGFYQENKAERALEQLKGYITKRVRVLRATREREIDATDLVPGDIIYVSQGDRVSADARIIYTSDLQLDEALLTGESLPITKKIDPLREKLTLAERVNMLYSGTLVTQGFARAVVVATGKNTEIGKIASAVASQKEAQTPMQLALRKFIFKAAGIIVLLSAIILAIARSNGLPLLDSFLISIAVLVAAVPEGLPIVMTVILAIGVQRLAKKNGVVRKLAAAETLGSTSIILTDKTGTLTQAKMALSRINIFEQSKKPDVGEPKNFLLSIALLNLESVVENPDESPEKWNIIGRPLENAVIQSAASLNILYPDIRAGEDPILLLPFNSSNKFSASIYQLSEKHGWAQSYFKNKKPYVLSMVGAPEKLLEYSRFNLEEKQSILAQIEAMATSGDRVIGVALKELSSISDINIRDEAHYKDLHFLGTMSFRDPLRVGVAEAIREVQRAGVRVVILTGDHQGTAIAVASELGITIRPENVLQGQELDQLTVEEIKTKLLNLKLVARVSPQGKLKIAQAFQEVGEIVAMNGDGINDAPALKEADIGIAMGSGTDVTKEVADLVLLDDNFKTIAEAIKEGRNILRNLRKAIVYLASSIFDSIFLIAGALLFGIALPMNALQILWVNFFTDSFPGIAIAFEKGIDAPESRPTDIRKGLFTSEMKFIVFIAGTFSSIGLFLMYWLFLRAGYDPTIVRTFVFVTFGTYTLFLGFSMRSLKKSIFEYNPFGNPYMVGSIFFGLILMAIAVYVPFFQGLFNTVDLSSWWLLLSLGFSAVNIFIIEISKLIFRHKVD